jgi:hypothetical protein
VRGVRVNRVLAIGAPPHWGWALAAAVFALTPFVIPTGLLKPAEAKSREQTQEAVDTTRVAVKRQMDQLRELAEQTPVLQDALPKEDENLDLGGIVRQPTPADIRHEALKKIDRYEDAVRQKKNADRYQSVHDMKRMMRAVKPPDSPGAPTESLTKALQQGDFKTAREEIEKLREQLATLKSEEDQEMVRKIGDQLEELSKQLERLAGDDDLKKQLERAGIGKEDIDKALETLSKKDLDQLQKKLQESGMSKDLAEQLARKLQQRQESKSMAGKLAQNMKGSATQAKAGAADAASAALGQAGDQLSQLEQLEQEMAQLEAAANAVAEAKDAVGSGCASCGGTGRQGNGTCGSCGGTGSGAGQGGGKMGANPGQGRGGRAESDPSAVAFKTERQKVHTGEGTIVGQLVFEGEQVPGEASSELSRTIAAAEREASDAVHRDRIPRQYHKAVRDYFTNLRRGVGADAAEPAPAGETSDDPEEPAPEKPADD